MGDEKYYRESETFKDNDGNDVEINKVVYERSDGSIDYVEQTKVNGHEVGHHTEHPDGTVHDYGIYAELENDECSDISDVDSSESDEDQNFSDR